MKNDDELSEADDIVKAVLRIRELGERNRRLYEQRNELVNQSQEIGREMACNDEEVSILAQYLKTGRAVIAGGVAFPGLPEGTP